MKMSFITKNNNLQEMRYAPVLVDWELKKYRPSRGYSVRYPSLVVSSRGVTHSTHLLNKMK